MKNFLLLLVFVFGTMHAQTIDTERFYAKMATQDAEELQYDFPDEVSIIAKNGDETVVSMTKLAGHELHEKVLVNGPGYMYKATEAEALKSLYQSATQSRVVIDFTITEDEIVQEAINEIDASRIENHILELEAYGTRHHATVSGTQSAIDLKAKWEAMAAAYGRTDVSVRLFDHVNTSMPSVIMTIEGATLPEEFIIVGGHLDSTSSQAQTNAPGADDDASGIATITEATRALFEIGYVPQRTIEIMAYAAEEIGLVGSSEIASQYASNGVEVGAVVQFDMTNFKGSTNDVSFVTDFTNGTLNNYLMSLLDHYNASGDHQVTYGTSLCNYGCSDHASWTEQGFMASFPFEADFGEHNDNIHTPNDVFSVTGTANHAAKFAKLCTEFLIETSKSFVLGVDEVLYDAVSITTNNGNINFNVAETEQQFIAVTLNDIAGNLITKQKVTGTQGNIKTTKFAQGLYILSFTTEDNKTVVKKVIIK